MKSSPLNRRCATPSVASASDRGTSATTTHTRFKRVCSAAPVFTAYSQLYRFHVDSLLLR